ncbi:MAG: hypothetical protein HYZ42_05015 [Bacteroidetes bacterium]|nr:hypothetical protein [Bacteroidota bacterium]
MSNYRLIMFLLTFVTACFSNAQSIKVDTLKYMEGDPSYPEKSIIYPIFKTGNLHIDSILNQHVKNRFTYDERINESIDSALIHTLNLNTRHIDFEITYNDHYLVSFLINAKGFVANLLYSEYYTYNVKTGMPFYLYDLLDTTTNIMDTISKDLKNQFYSSKFISLISLSRPQARDRTRDIEIARESYKECEKVLTPKDFLLFEDHLEILSTCKIYQADHNMNIHLNYKYSELKPFLKIKL